MDQAHRTKNIPGRLLHRMALGTWIVLILLTGTYIRVREGNVIPRTDWLVLAQLLAGSVGALLGIALLRRRPPIGHGVKIVLLYLFLAGFSAFWSHYPWIVFGYWLLLLGSALLTMGLVHNRDSHIRLDTVESAWLIVITFVLIKDLLIALFIPSLGAGGEMKRLGMGVTHANTISFFACVAFWISFKERKLSHEVLVWVVRTLFVFIIIASKSRVSLFLFIVGGIVRFGFTQRRLPFRWLYIYCVTGVVLSLVILALSLELRWARTGFEFVNRSQDIDTILSLTRRTEIWSVVVHKMAQGSVFNTLFGYGYGISRLVLNDGGDTANFYFYHCHNAFLEHALTTGLAGLTAFLLIIAYSTRWLRKPTLVPLVHTPEIAIHAATAVVFLLIKSFVEVPIGGKVNPVMLLFFVYLCALDTRLTSSVVKERNSNNMVRDEEKNLCPGQSDME